jgi:S1-C subfamily serine protease
VARWNRFRFLTLVVVIIWVMAGVAACSKTNLPISQTSQIPPASDKVLVKSSRFDPSSILITAGMSVSWSNQDDSDYLIVDDNQAFAFDLPARSSFSLAFKEPGTFNYHCAVRPDIQGTVVVTPGAAVDSWNPEELISKVRASVVTIQSKNVTKGARGSLAYDKLSGTGWILDKSGLIVTNNHVVEGFQNVSVTLANNQTYQVQEIQSDPIDDLAILKIGAADLQPAGLGDSSLVREGDLVFTIGNALGQGLVSSTGFISNTNATVNIGSQETIYNALQTTAQIFPGNSGGPLFNMQGQIIGITTAAKMNSVGRSISAYAINSNTAASVIEQLTFTGYASHPWLGVVASSVSDLESSGYKLNINQGAFITMIETDSPAEISGLKTGDIILRMGENNIQVVGDLVQKVHSSPVGQQVAITFWRDNHLNFTVTTLNSSHNSVN